MCLRNYLMLTFLPCTTKQNEPKQENDLSGKISTNLRSLASLFSFPCATSTICLDLINALGTENVKL